MLFTLKVNGQTVISNVSMEGNILTTSFTPPKSSIGIHTTTLLVASYLTGSLYSSDITQVMNFEILDRCSIDPINWQALPIMADVVYEVN
jgi:hypothetical protein